MRQNRPPQHIDIYGKIPPQNQDAEIAVLGAILLNGAAINEVADLLVPESFYNEQHKLIYKAMDELYKERSPIDILTVCARLKKNNDLENAGGLIFVSSLTNKIASSSHISSHAQLITQDFFKRNLIAIAQETLQKAFSNDTDAFDIQAELIAKATNIIQISTSDYTAKTRMFETYSHILKAMESKTGITGLPYPWKTVNEWTAGLQNGEVIVIAGLPGTFKTGIAMNITKALNDMPVPIPSLIFQQEMTTIQTGIREIAMESQIPNTKLKSGQLDDHEKILVNQAIRKIETSAIYVNSAPGLTTTALRTIGTKMVQNHGVRLIVIDYLQLMNHQKQKGENDTAPIERTTKELKTIAKELRIPIIVLSQLTKEASREPLKIPTLNMLRGSGSIEQDADIIFMLWNPAKYDSQFIFSNEGKDIEARGKVFIVPLKFRDGEPNTVLALNSYPWINTFIELHDNYSSSDSGLSTNTDFDNSKDDPF
jgi:replicative DNA helicase